MPVAFLQFRLLRYLIGISVFPLLYIQKAVNEPSRSHSAAFLLPENNGEEVLIMVLKITPNENEKSVLDDLEMFG